MIVLDSSALVELLLGTPEGITIGRRWHVEGQAHAPHLATVEAAHVVRKLTLVGAISADRGRRLLGRLPQLPFQRHGHDLLLPRMWELKGHLTAYDAVYVALAEALDLSLLTMDGKLAAAPGHRASIELVAA